MANRSDLAKRLAKKTFLSQKESLMLIEELTKIIVDEIRNGNDVTILGLGKFYSQLQKPRQVRNPKTMEPMVLEEHRAMKFKSAGLVRKLLKGDAKED